MGVRIKSEKDLAGYPEGIRKLLAAELCKTNGASSKSEQPAQAASAQEALLAIRIAELKELVSAGDLRGATAKLAEIETGLPDARGLTAGRPFFALLERIRLSFRDAWRGWPRK